MPRYSAGKPALAKTNAGFLMHPVEPQDTV